MTRDELESDIAKCVKQVLKDAHEAKPINVTEATEAIQCYFEELKNRGWIGLLPIEEEIVIEFACRPGDNNG